MGLDKRNKAKTGRKMGIITNQDIAKIRAFCAAPENAPKWTVFLAYFDISLNTGLLFSDLIKLKFEDVEHIPTEGGYITIKRNSTQNPVEVIINQLCVARIRELLRFYANFFEGIPGFGNPIKGYLFKRLDKVTLGQAKDAPISLVTVSKRFGVLREELKIDYPIGNESLRKTYIRKLFQLTGDFGYIARLLGYYKRWRALQYMALDDMVLRIIGNETVT
jgi:integrase